MRISAFLFLVACLGFQACGERDHDHDSGPEESGHVHVAPHGGALVVLGDEFAHVELVVNQETGALDAYVLDGEAQGALRVAHPVLQLSVHLSSGDLVLDLQPIASALTGETAGDTSHFSGRSDRLKGLDHFQATFALVEVKGSIFRQVSFHYPQGNEDGHGHDHDHDHDDDHDHDHGEDGHK